MAAAITKVGVLSMQVCVPTDWTDEQVTNFANQENLCGTTSGWVIRKQGDKGLAGHDERVPCSSVADHVHIMLDA